MVGGQRCAAVFEVEVGRARQRRISVEHWRELDPGFLPFVRLSPFWLRRRCFFSFNLGFATYLPLTFHPRGLPLDRRPVTWAALLSRFFFIVDTGVGDSGDGCSTTAHFAQRRRIPRGAHRTRVGGGA